MKTEIVSLTQVEDKLLTIRGQNVLLDSDVAALYRVETREVNQAIQRNPDKFPEGYIIQLDQVEWQNLKSQIVISSWGGKNKFPQSLHGKRPLHAGHHPQG